MRTLILALVCLLGMTSWGFGADDKPHAPAPKKLLIVARNSFHSTLKPFVEQKKNLLPTEVISLEQIVKDTKGVDDAEKLKRYLYNRWKKDKIGYVLLVGDGEMIPVRHYTWMDLSKTNGVSYFPSDLYYGDLAKKDGSFEDWNAKKDGINARYFAELQFNTGKDNEPVNVDQIDYLPEVGVGRWPIHTISQLKAVIEKTVRYENHVLSDDLPAIRRSAFIVGPNASDTRGVMDEWGKKLEAVSTWRPVRQYARYEGREFDVPIPNEDSIVNILESGVGMIFHDGHGGADCWADCLGNNRLKTLKNDALPPVMFSLGCDTAHYAPLVPYMRYVDVDGKEHAGLWDKETFDAPPPPPRIYQKGQFKPSSLGVEWVCAPRKGCVAYMGAASGAAGSNDIIISGFVNYVVGHDKPRLGDAWTTGITKYHNDMGLASMKAGDTGPVVVFQQGMLFQLFGDPSMRLPRSPYPWAHALVLAEGKFGNALDAKASPTWVVGDDRYRKPPITVECWAKLNNPENYNVVVSSDPKSSSRHWEIFSDRGSGKFCAYLPGYEPSEIVSEANIVDWRWHHVAMTFDGKRVQLYVDGKRVADQAVQPKDGLKWDDGPLMFGQVVSLDARIGCDGLIDDVRISNVVRVIDRAPEKEMLQDRQTIGLWRFDN